jgi:endonuclease/exonuclease/phosphatase family metal-dependent hydrolase
MFLIYMKSFLTFVFLFAFFGFSFLRGEDKNLLSGKYTQQELQQLLIPQARWIPFPRLNDRAAWANANKESLKIYIRFAEKYIDYKWPTVPATSAMQIARTGSRTEYQRISYEKRTVLASMILAEIAENKGRFTDPIINGVWSICEESWWGASAHLPDEYKGLMDVTRPRVDLYVGVTGGVLAWADYFLGEKFDAVSPQIRKRIYHEINTRIFQPLMTYPHWWMTSREDGRPPNNWNPWICSNWLTCALLLEKDDNRRAEMVGKTLKILDAFLNPYPQDGGCDEGPGYWGAAVGALYDNFALLNLATKDAFRYVFEDEKVKNMGRFIYRAQISENYALNFADASPRSSPPFDITFRYGRDIRDETMMRFAASFRREASGDLIRAHFARDFFNLFLGKELETTAPGMLFPREVWLPNLQVAIARDKDGTTQGFYFGAKGGRNNENHNHNDVGNFVVYYDGLPLLIDVGTGKYTAKTFTSERYDIWNHRSDYHNTPSINGVPQRDGAEFKASDVQYKPTAETTTFSLEMAKAYPAEAGINSWRRTIELKRGKGVVITDIADLQKAGSVTEHFMTCYPAEKTAAGELTIHAKDKNGAAVDFVIRYDAGKFSVVVEKIPLVTEGDLSILANWGDEVRRINFHAIAPEKKDTYVFEVARRDKLSLAEKPVASAETELRVLSFNIWIGGGNSIPETLEVIKKTGADIVGIQESFKHGKNTALAFAGELGWSAHNDKARKGGSTTIISRFPIVALSKNKIGAKLKLGENRFVWMFDIHLPPNPYEPYLLYGMEKEGYGPTLKTAKQAIASAWKTRGPQVELTIADILEAQKEGWPVFLVGDFNEPSCQDWTARAVQSGHCVIPVKWPVTQAFIEKAGMFDSYRVKFPDEVTQRGITWTPRPGKRERHDRIDFVFYSGECVSVKNVQVIGEKSGLSDIGFEKYPSDHRAVLATFEIAKR